MSPDFRELVTEIELVFPDFAECDLVIEVVPEQAHVIVCSLRGFSVFATCVVAQAPPVVIAQAFKELLQVWLVKSPMLGQVGVVIRERKETVPLMG